MMSAYQAFTAARSTEADPAALFTQLRALDATMGIQHQGGSQAYTLKKATAWTAPQITAAQNVLDTVPAMTVQSTAQSEIDAWPISQKAFALALIDAINVLRTHPAINLPAVTPAQALTAIRNKAGTL